MVLEFLNKLVFTVFREIIEFISNLVLRPVISFVIQFLVGIMSYYLYQVSVLLLSAIDLISDFFQMMAGIQMANGSKITFGDSLYNEFTGGLANQAGGDMLFQVLTSEPVMGTFSAVFVVGVFLTVLSTMIVIIKQEFNPDKPNAKGPIIAAALKSFIYMIFVPVICIFGVFVSNAVLNLVHTATSGDGDVTVSGVVFTAAAYNARYRALESWVSLDDPISGAVASGINALVTSFVGAFGIDGEDLEYSSSEAVAIGAEIMDRYIYISKHNEPLSSQSLIQIIIYVDGGAQTVFTAKDAAKKLKKYDSGVTPDDFTTIGYLDTFLKDCEDDGGRFLRCETKAEAKAASKEGNKIALYWASTSFRAYFNSIQVSKDFNASRINYVALFASAIIVIKAMAQAFVGLIMRVYKATAFFLILPGVIGLSPLDGGASFGSWRKTFVGEVLAGYGFILAMNIYLLLTPLVVTLDIDYQPTNAPPAFGGMSSGAVSAMTMIGSGMAEGIIRMIFIIAGALMIEKMASMISGFIGGVDVAGIGKGMMSEIGKTVATGAVVGGGMVMGGLATSALMYGAIGDKISSGVGKGVGSAFKDNFKKQTAGAKGIGKVGKGIKGVFSGLGGAGKQLGSNALTGIKGMPKAVSNKFSGMAGVIKGSTKKNGGPGLMKAAKFGAVAGISRLAAPFNKSAQALHFARANYLDSKAGFEAAGAKVDSMQEAYDNAVKGGNKKKIDEAQENLNQARAEYQGAAQKYIDDANKYEGTAVAIRDGEKENAKAAGLYALETVLDTLPGADIVKGLWNTRKDAAKEVDDSSEYNRDRAEGLNKAAKDLRDKLVSHADPVGRAHTKRAEALNAATTMADIQTKLENSHKEKMEQLDRFTKLLANAGDDAARRASIMASAAACRLTLPDAHGQQKLMTTDQLKIYTDIALDIEVMRKGAGRNTRALMKGAEEIMKKYAEALAKPVFKDIMDVLEQIKNSKQ